MPKESRVCSTRLSLLQERSLGAEVLRQEEQGSLAADEGRQALVVIGLPRGIDEGVSQFVEDQIG